MLELIVPAIEGWNDKKEEFVILKPEQKLKLEHSLVSLSKWESKWCKPFLTDEAKTKVETIDYIRCMTLTQNVNPEVYTRITNQNIMQVNNYIAEKQTAAWFNDEGPSKKSSEQITADLIYYWMVVFNIPFECQKWHLNRLLTLVRICEVKNRKPKKMNQKDIIARNRALNEARKKQLHTTG